MNPRERRAGFTLVELGIVLLIVGILATLSVSTYRWMVEKARMTQARVALAHLKETETIYFSDMSRYTDDIFALDFNPLRYDYYDISVRITDNVNRSTYKGFAHGRGAMAGDLWTVTDNTDPVQDISSPFRR